VTLSLTFVHHNIPYISLNYRWLLLSMTLQLYRTGWKDSIALSCSSRQHGSRQLSSRHRIFLLARQGSTLHLLLSRNSSFRFTHSATAFLSTHFLDKINFDDINDVKYPTCIPRWNLHFLLWQSSEGNERIFVCRRKSAIERREFTSWRQSGSHSL
jgi:hypothetical protein